MHLIIAAFRKLFVSLIPSAFKGFGAWLLAAFVSIGGQIIIKLLLSLGVGFYTFAKLNDFFDVLLQQYVTAYNSVPALMLAFLDIGGFSTGISTMLSGISFLISYQATKVAVTFWGRAIT